MKGGNHEHEQIGIARERERCADEQRGVGAEVAPRAHRVGIGGQPARHQRAAGAAEREREHDLPERHASPVACERRRMGIRQHAGRAQQADHEQADCQPPCTPEHAPRGDRRTRSVRACPGGGVDQREDRRDEQGDEEELQRPTPQDAVARDEVGGTEARRLRAGVEGQRGELRGGTDAAQEISREIRRSPTRGFEVSIAELSPGREPSMPTTAAPLPTSAAWSPCATGATSAATCWPSEGRRTSCTPSSRSACSTVRSQPAAGRRCPSPERRRTSGAPGRPTARSATPARSRRPAGGCRASSRAPAASAVVPSTEANTSEVWVTLPTSVRASSTRAPVPEALSFAPGPGGRSSRPAMNTSASRERPWPVTTPSTLLIGTVRPLAPGARKCWMLTSAPEARRRAATQAAAARSPTLPGSGPRSGSRPRSPPRGPARRRTSEAASCGGAPARCGRRRAARRPARARRASRRGRGRAGAAQRLVERGPRCGARSRCAIGAREGHPRGASSPSMHDCRRFRRRRARPRD